MFDILCQIILYSLLKLKFTSILHFPTTVRLDMLRGEEISKIILVVDEFIDWHFTKHQLKCIMKRADKNNPYNDAALQLYEAIYHCCPTLVQMLEEFTPHPACRYSLLREVFRLRAEKELKAMIEARTKRNEKSRQRPQKQKNLLANN